MRNQRSQPRWLALLGVASLHLLVLWLFSRATTAHTPADAHRDHAARVTLLLIPSPPPPRLPPSLPVAPRLAVAQPRRANLPAKSIARSSASAAAKDPPPRPFVQSVTTPSAITVTSAAAPDLPASAADHPSSLLETDATRRAIRESARSARDASVGGGAGDRLAAGIKSAGKGDCLKGEYPGSGMGLLSLPFLAVAEAAGNCSK